MKLPRLLWLTVGDRTEAAYRRGDLFEKRRRLMDAWAAQCAVAESIISTLILLKSGRSI
jgi:hypothetical protein